MKRPYIAKDTHEPLVVFDHYHIAEDGSILTHPTIVTTSGDYGADPLPDGTFRMVPSGDIVNFEERSRRLRR